MTEQPAEDQTEDSPEYDAELDDADDDTTGFEDDEGAEGDFAQDVEPEGEPLP